MREALELIADGVRAERAGALDRALESYVAAAESGFSDPDVRAEALTRQADVLRSQCEWDAALKAALTAQRVAAEAGLSQRLHEATIAETNVLMARGELNTARPKLEHVVAVSTDPKMRGIALQNLGTIHAQSGHPRAAERAFGESLGNFQKAGYSRGEAIALNNLGRLALDANDAVRARPLLQRALDIAREIEDGDLGALAGLNLAWTLCATGDADRAQDLAMAALGYFAGCNNRWREIECFRLIGEINERCEDLANAARCYGIALSFAEQIGCEPEIRVTRDRLAALARRGGSQPRASVS